MAAIKKKVAKKKVVKKKAKPRAKIAVTAKSQITKKAPTARLKKRRAANTKKGYFPNPLHVNHYIVAVRKSDDKIVGYYDGLKWFKDSKKKAVIFHDKSQAVLVAKSLPNAKSSQYDIGVYTEKK